MMFSRSIGKKSVQKKTVRFREMKGLWVRLNVAESQRFPQHFSTFWRGLRIAKVKAGETRQSLEMFNSNIRHLRISEVKNFEAGQRT